MADQTQSNTVLAPDDIPGCDLDLNCLASYRVEQLKFWLACRGDSLKNLSTKATCIQRINNYIKNGKKDAIVDPTTSNIYHRGKKLQAETKLDILDTSTANVLTGNLWCKKLQWQKSLSDVPTFTIKELEKYFEKSGKTGKIKKRAEELLFDNFLDSIECCSLDNFFYIRAVCSASYCKTTFHKLSCSISKSSSDVLSADCTCIAGDRGFCNHIYALLKLLAQFVLDRVESIPMQLPCTSRPCGWTVPKVRKINVQKETVMESVIKKPRLDSSNKGVKCNLNDVRSEEEREYKPHDIANMREKLKDLNPNIPMVNAIRQTISDDEWCDSKFGKVPIFSPLAYQCSKMGNNFNYYINIFEINTDNTTSNYPDFPHQPVPQFYQFCISDYTLSEQLVLNSLQLTSEEVNTLEQSTRNQSENVHWHEQRAYRVTASRIFDVYQWKRGLEKHAEKYVFEEKKESAFVKKKLEHGKMYEPVAIDKYQMCLREEGHNVDVSSCGLVVDTHNLWLGCSPDGKVCCDGVFGIVECKCPEQYKHSDVFDVAKDQNNFMLYVDENNKLQLHKTHSTYYQIQCQLALTGVPFCDLAVYTFKSIGIVRIAFDLQFWLNVTNIVGERYFKYILPHLVQLKSQNHSI